MDLAGQAFQLLRDARRKAPLTRTAWEKLADDIEALAKQAEDPDDIREVTSEQLLWLEPGGKFQDKDYA